jgi:UDP-N-acetylmuramate dehydrogenase
MHDADLSGLNSLRLHSRADRLVPIDSLRDLHEAADRLRAEPAGSTTRVTVLGGGSNVVLRPRVDGLVLHMRNRGIAIEVLARGDALLTVAAGERWHDVVLRALGQGYGGLENLALIPGSAGAAPIQNIGAYGLELADRFVALRALDLDSGKVRSFDREACRFGYRDSLFKQPEGARLVVVDLTLRVSRRPDLRLGYPDLARELAALGRSRPTPVDVAEAVIRVRRRKLPDPRLLGNAGSFYKNPVIAEDAAAALARSEPGLVMHPAGTGRRKLAAGQLIDRCGWKGVRRGAVGTWKRQALVLVNFGGATASELLGLSDAIRRDVRERFGVELELEPRVLGQD